MGLRDCNNNGSVYVSTGNWVRQRAAVQVLVPCRARVVQALCIVVVVYCCANLIMLQP